MTDLFLTHPSAGWVLDLTTAHLQSAQLASLPWSTVFQDMEALEAGAIANPDEGRQVGHYWLRAAERAPTVHQGEQIGTTRDAVLSFAEGVRSGSIAGPDGMRFRDVLHIGIGGSALGPQLLIDALDGSADGLRLHFIDNIDPDGIQRTLHRIDDLRHTLVVVVSKSGGTAETMNALELVRRAYDRQGLDSASRSVAVTGEGSRLDKRASAEGWLRRFAMWDWVGGRTSVTSAVGLLPGALAGIDMRALLDGAAFMDDWTRSDRWQENPAALLAGAWHVIGHGRGNKAMVVLPYSDRLLLFSRYLQQLVMESIGKKHNLKGEVVEQGLSVFGNKGSTDQHSFVQQLRDGRNDFFAVLIGVLSDGNGDVRPVNGAANAGDFLQGFLLGTRRALHSGGRSTLTLTVPRVDAHILGGLIALFERAVGLYASLININAYHQPGVEAGKLAASDVLALADRVRSLLSATPQSTEHLARQASGDPTEVWYLLTRLEAQGHCSSGPSGWASCSLG